MFDNPLIIKDKNVFFWSDTHFGHKKEFVWGKRGFTSVEEHDIHLVNAINGNVGENDILFHLGDFCLNYTQEQFENILFQIKCNNIHYINGNHNSRIKQFEHDLNNPLRHKVKYMGNYVEAIINNQMIVMMHYPIYSWNAMRKGSWMIHGHEHGAVLNHNQNGIDGKILDIGVDNFPCPLSFESVKTIMANKIVKQVGHHEF